MSRKEVKVKLGLVTAITAIVFSLGACGGTETAEQQPSQSAQTEVSVEPATDPVEAEHISDMGDVESADTEPTLNPADAEPEAFTVSGQVVIALIETQSVSHPHIPKEEMVAIVMALNLDYITEEDRDAVMNEYGLSYEDLDGYLRAYKSHQNKVFEQSILYHYGVNESIESEYDLENWIYYAEIAFNPEDFEECKYFDDTVRCFETPSIKNIKDSLHITLNDMKNFNDEMQESVFAQYVVYQ